MIGSGPELAVALAATSVDRSRGLMGVSDLGELGGMLFEWEGEVRRGFWMKDTVIALDLAFFDRDGGLVDWTSLEPCNSDPCSIYVSPALFHWVLETPAGSLPKPAPTDRLERTT